MPDLPPKIYEPIELDLDETRISRIGKAEAGIREELSALGDKVQNNIYFQNNDIKANLQFLRLENQQVQKQTQLRERMKNIQSGEKESIEVEISNHLFQFCTEGVSKLGETS